MLAGGIIAALRAAPALRNALLGLGALLALWTAIQWVREDARRDLLLERQVQDVEAVGKADRSAYDWRECLVSGGVWDFARSVCRDPE